MFLDLFDPIKIFEVKYQNFLPTNSYKQSIDDIYKVSCTYSKIWRRRLNWKSHKMELKYSKSTIFHWISIYYVIFFNTCNHQIALKFFLHKPNIYKSVLKSKSEKVIILRYCKILSGGVSP